MIQAVPLYIQKIVIKIVIYVYSNTWLITGTW